MCIALCTIVAHNIAQNRRDNFPPYPPDNHHCSDDVYLREGGVSRSEGVQLVSLPFPAAINPSYFAGLSTHNVRSSVDYLLSAVNLA